MKFTCVKKFGFYVERGTSMKQIWYDVGQEVPVEVVKIRPRLLSNGWVSRESA